MLIHQQGRITFSQLFTFAVIVLVIINGIKFIKPWRDHYQLKEAMQATVNQARTLTDQEMITIVIDRAKKLGIKLKPQDIDITRIGQSDARMHTEYEVTLSFPFGFYRKLDFRPAVSSTR